MSQFSSASSVSRFIVIFIMKVLLAVVVCCIASGRAAMIKKNDSEIKLDDACLKDYGIEPEAISDGSQELTYEQIYCVAACIYKSKKIMNSDGTINEEVVDSHFTAEDNSERELFYAVYNACKDRTNCQLVQCMFEKLKSQLGSANDESGDFSQRLFSSNSVFKF